MACFLGQSIQWLPGVGPTWAQRLAQDGLKTFWDVLCCLPQRFIPYHSGPLSVNQSRLCVRVTIGQTLAGKPWRILAKTEHQDNITLLFFRKPKAPWPQGTSMWIYGAVENNASYGWTMTHPQRVPQLSQKRSTCWAEYTLPKPLTSFVFARWVNHILEQWPHKQWSPLHDPCLEQHSEWSMPWHQCFQQAHCPISPPIVMSHDNKSYDRSNQDVADVLPWQTALACSEWVANHVATLTWSEHHRHSGEAPCCPKTPAVIDVFLGRFGHQLTSCQSTAWSIIEEELTQKTPMLRLLNGDVGSGKTIVAFLALLQATASGQHQACLMAPTETLIRQHYHNLVAWAPPGTVQLVLGKGMRMGPTDAPVILGTHALLYDALPLDRMALVVIDEQQRFGVEQRSVLTQKYPVHSLYITATPIPRTFARLMSGDLAVSHINKRPGAALMNTYVMSSEKIPPLADWIQRCFHQDQRVYWVCPMITDDTSGVDTRWAYWDKFFPGKVGILHGRMTSAAKEGAIQAFRQGQTPLLVSTSVIEVGVHVSEATTMIIEDAPRFGMSQLHQLRGRVGRDKDPGHCFLLYNEPLLPYGRKRLQSLRLCHDGFAIAEQDWLMRGSGLVYGTQQSGHIAHRFIQRHSLHTRLAHLTIPAAKHFFQADSNQAKWLMSLFGLRADNVWMSG